MVGNASGESGDVCIHGVRCEINKSSQARVTEGIHFFLDSSTGEWSMGIG